MKNTLIENQDLIFRQAMEYVPILKEIYELHGGNAMIQYAHDECQRMLERKELFKETSCQGSCSFCCHQDIMMSKLEADYTREILKLNNLVPDPIRSKLQRELPKESLNFMARACPMLADENEEGKRLCTIYEARPLVCRTHNSLNEPKFCNGVDYPNAVIQEVRLAETEAITFAIVIIEQQLGFHGLEAEFVGMHNL
jgi:Fe-S-cluster containining protein